MSATQAHIERIEEKLKSVLSRHQSLKKENDKLKKQLEKTEEEKASLVDQLKQSALQISMLKSSEGSAAKSTRATLEKRINAYVKEIDRCIALLGDQA
ncbi:MAG: DNA replication initiation control protein YabA [Bacteroidetes bacterium]|nr:DNA replication initiation control protein YabA [Bacteroidota bacterium]